MQLLTQHSINVFNTMRQQKICPQSLRVVIARGNVYDFSLWAAVVVSISNIPLIHRGVIRYSKIGSVWAMEEIFLGRDILAKIKLLWIKMQLRIK